MKNFLITLMIAFGSLVLIAPEADARRLGGGGSFGKQSQSFGRQAQAPQRAAPNQAANQNAARGNQAAATGSPWRNILGGALLGLGLGALLAHFGIGGALASLIAGALMIGLFVLLAMFLYRMLRGKDARPAYAGHQSGHSGGNHYSGTQLRTPEIGTRLDPYAEGRDARDPRTTAAAFQTENTAGGAPGEAVEAATIPADFDVPAFVRNAKTYFIRLQAAWDRADINDIREFTTPEMFAELRMQLQERGAAQNATDVVSLDADVLGVETIGDDYLVGVRFSGLIREEEGAEPQPFTEIWNLSKPAAGNGGWVLAGIQQVS